jgi:RND family efflux transporter MFP subunit
MGRPHSRKIFVRRYFKVLLPIAVIAIGVVSVGYLKATKPETPAQPSVEKVWTVDTVAVAFEDVRPSLTLFGEIVAGRQVDLRALVPGPVESVWDGFVDGGTVAEGTVLVSIDPFDAEQAVIERKAALDEARSRLKETRIRLTAERALAEEDARQVEIHERDVARRESLLGNAVSERGLDEARLTLSRGRVQAIQRQQSVATLEAGVGQQTAIIAGLEAALARARRALDDTELKAPFDGYLADAAAQPGERLSIGDRVGRLIDSRRLEVRFHMSGEQFGRAIADASEVLGTPADVVWRTGEKARRFAATIDRIDSEIDAATGGVTVYARLAGEGDASAMLRPGAFVEVTIADRTYRQVSRIPETALHDGGTVYVVVGERLEARAVERVGRDGEAALISGEIGEGETIVVSRFTEIGPGMKVAVP